MKRHFEITAKKHKCNIVSYENINNFTYRCIFIGLTDENEMELDGYDYEYYIDDNKDEIIEHFDNWLKEQLS